MSNFSSSKSVILKHVRLTWLDAFKPGAGMNGGAPKYKVSALITPNSENATLAKNAMLFSQRSIETIEQFDIAWKELQALT
jgi:hypothetical protein